MLLIPCPYCGPRPELESRNAGHAHITRAIGVDDQAWAETLFFRDNPKGIMAERWRHFSGCGRFFNVLRDTVSDAILASYETGQPRPDVPPPVPEGEAPRIGAGDEVTPGRASTAPRAAGGSTAAGRSALSSTDDPTRATRAIHWLRRCSPTGFTCSAARSSTIARAACSRRRR